MTWNRQSLVLGSLVILGGLGFSLWCGSQSDAVQRLPPADDAFLSYLQAARGLSIEMLQPPPAMPGEDRLRQLAAACDELERLQTAARRLSPADVARLRNEHAQLVSETRALWAALGQQPAQFANASPAEWSRYEQAFRYCGDLGGAVP